MCQLVGYIGDRPIAPLLLKTLELQEPYFGAHATGIGVLNDGKLRIIKGNGHVAKIKRMTSISELKGTTGIGHSRYSSLAREDPRFDTAAMAHPFTNDEETIALMHNGNITNFKEHWARLRGSHTFKSYNPDIDWITDSEVAVHMVSEAVSVGEGFEEALKDIVPRCAGNVLLCVVSQEEPETIYLANRHQPCYVGLGGDEVMWCSSRIGLEPLEGELNRIYQPPKNSLMKLTRGKVKTMVLDPDWKVPELELDKEFLKEAIVNTLSYGDSDFADLKDALNHNLLARAYGKSQDEWAEMRRNGVDIVNPYIETLNELIEEGRIRQRIDPRLEGGTPNTPRFAYSLA